MPDHDTAAFISTEHANVTLLYGCAKSSRALRLYKRDKLIVHKIVIKNCIKCLFRHIIVTIAAAHV